MPPSPEEDTTRVSIEKTLAELVYRFPDPVLRAQLEKFRIEYEEEFGETDLTRHYTSMLPTKDQEWLSERHPKRYFDGLPPFVQAFFKAKMLVAHRKGKLDDMPDDLLYLFVSGQMDAGKSGQGR
jgi:hypothetical protein